jgi:hypothetical protein
MNVWIRQKSKEFCGRDLRMKEEGNNKKKVQNKKKNKVNLIERERERERKRVARNCGLNVLRDCFKIKHIFFIVVVHGYAAI